MSDKVKLPKNIVEIIEHYQTLEPESWSRAILLVVLQRNIMLGGEDAATEIREYANNEENFNLLLKAFANGYEIEKSPDDLIHDLFYKTKSILGEFDDIKTAYQKGILDTLYALKLKIRGVNTYD